MSEKMSYKRIFDKRKISIINDIQTWYSEIIMIFFHLRFFPFFTLPVVKTNTLQPTQVTPTDAI